MDSLNDTAWDVVIDGTGLPQSLLALALSRAGRRILHLDRNEYYGGDEAALSLDEAEAWAKSSQGQNAQCSHARVTRPYEPAEPNIGLAASRAYTLTLSPQLIYGRSNLLQALVSSRTHEQLDFQAVGSFWVVEPSKDTSTSARILRVPSGREDIFRDNSISRSTKRSLMNFIRSISVEPSPAPPQLETDNSLDGQSFPDVLATKFRLSAESHQPLLALTLSHQPPERVTYKEAVDGIKRHMLSMGMFGSGFGAVMPKYGGLSEVVQVACRAGAVGGGVYVLGKSIKSSRRALTEHGNDTHLLQLELDSGETVTTPWLVKLEEHTAPVSTWSIVRSISIIDSPLSLLFPPTSAEGGVTPAGAVILMPPADGLDAPIHIMAHSSNSGECPKPQCVLHASVLSGVNHERSFERIQEAVCTLLRRVASTSSEHGESGSESDSIRTPQSLWQMAWTEAYTASDSGVTTPEIPGEIFLPSLSSSLALEDAVLDHVSRVWHKLTGEDEKDFMKFAVREGEEADNT